MASTTAFDAVAALAMSPPTLYASNAPLVPLTMSLAITGGLVVITGFNVVTKLVRMPAVMLEPSKAIGIFTVTYCVPS